MQKTSFLSLHQNAGRLFYSPKNRKKAHLIGNKTVDSLMQT